MVTRNGCRTCSCAPHHVIQSHASEDAGGTLMLSRTLLSEIKPGLPTGHFESFRHDRSSRWCFRPFLIHTRGIQDFYLFFLVRYSCWKEKHPWWRFRWLGWTRLLKATNCSKSEHAHLSEFCFTSHALHAKQPHFLWEEEEPRPEKSTWSHTIRPEEPEKIISGEDLFSVCTHTACRTCRRWRRSVSGCCPA